MVIDKGSGYEYLNDLLEVGSCYMDILKFGFGTSCLYPRHILRQKLSLARVYSVAACPGGTLGEIALVQGVYDRYLNRCVKLGFSAIEISDGTISLPQKERCRAIASAKSVLGLVISEVGKKLDPTTDIRAHAKQVVDDLNAGADYVILEGRESGEGVGVFSGEGQIQTDLLQAFVSELPEDVKQKVIWEAPKKSQQVDFISKFGQDVNLGNIQPTDVIALECLRLGLRADTLAMTIDEPKDEPK